MKKNELVLVPMGGLGNRIYAITSAIAFSKDYNKKLKVVWFKDHGMGATFHSLFDLIDKENIEIIDARLKHYIYDRPRKKNLWLTLLPQKLLFDKRLYSKYAYDRTYPFVNELNSPGRIYFNHFRKFYEIENILTAIQPKGEIQDLIDKYVSDLPKNIIGIHIRRSDHTVCIQNSPDYLFINKIKEEISKDPSLYFYLATDSEKVKINFKEIFTEKIITKPVELRRDTEESIIDSLIELFILASTKKIYGSYYSTYSTLAAELFNKPLEILSL